jgi:hypothetical protein
MEGLCHVKHVTGLKGPNSGKDDGDVTDVAGSVTMNTAGARLPSAAGYVLKQMPHYR